MSQSDRRKGLFKAFSALDALNKWIHRLESVLRIGNSKISLTFLRSIESTTANTWSQPHISIITSSKSLRSASWVPSWTCIRKQPQSNWKSVSPLALEARLGLRFPLKALLISWNEFDEVAPRWKWSNFDPFSIQRSSRQSSRANSQSLRWDAKLGKVDSKAIGQRSKLILLIPSTQRFEAQTRGLAIERAGMGTSKRLWSEAV